MVCIQVGNSVFERLTSRLVPTPSHFFFTPLVAFVNSPKLLDPSSTLDLVLFKVTVGRLLKRLRSFPRNRTQQNICFKFWAFIKYSNDTLKIKYKEGVTILADTDWPIAP